MNMPDGHDHFFDYVWVRAYWLACELDPDNEPPTLMFADGYTKGYFDGAAAALGLIGMALAIQKNADWAWWPREVKTVEQHYDVLEKDDGQGDWYT